MTARLRILSVVLLTAGTLSAQNELPDSVTSDSLGEVVVEARFESTSPQITRYIPSRVEKRSASGGIELLSQMAIPQISVNTFDGSVETASRKSVAIYIDGEPASVSELNSMRTEDVRRVEYLVYPTDARFQHEPYVVNFVMAHYEYGGYAKLGARERFISGNSSASTYAKMAYKSMTYDLNATDSYSSRRHYGTFGSELFRFPEGDVTRDTEIDRCRYESNTAGVAFRAKYMNSSSVVSNTVSLSASNVPHRDVGGNIVITPDLTGTDGSYLSYGKNNVITAQWSGVYYFRLNSGWSLSMMPTFQYARNKSLSRYESGIVEQITNNARENSWLGQFSFQLNKQLNNENSVDINGMGVCNNSDITYYGSSPSDEKFRQLAGMIAAGYSLSLDKFYGRVSAALVGETNKISGERVSDILPVLSIDGQYSFNDSHSADLSVTYRTNMNDAGLKSPNRLQRNEFLWYEGNPGLKNSRTVSADLSYTWLPDNKLSVVADAGIFRIFDRPVPIFTPVGQDMMLRRMENDGDYQCINMGLSLTGRFLNRKLVIGLKPQGWFYNTTGVYKQTKANFVYSAQVSYYFGRFYSSLSYTSRESSPIQFSSSATYVKEKDSYELGIGWRNSHWNMKLTLANIFRKSWVSSTDYLNGPDYRSKTHRVGINHRQFALVTVNYTFGFGKKVRRADEISGAAEAGSAMLK